MKPHSSERKSVIRKLNNKSLDHFWLQKIIYLIQLIGKWTANVHSKKCTEQEDKFVQD